MVTLSQLADHARLLRDARDRFDALSKAELTGRPPGPLVHWGYERA
jgi:hypothetical protein